MSSGPFSSSRISEVGSGSGTMRRAQVRGARLHRRADVSASIAMQFDITTLETKLICKNMANS